MFNQLRLVGAAVLIFTVVLGGTSAGSQDKKPAPTPEVVQNPQSLYHSLREVINVGAQLFNEEGDQAGCYHVYQGALLASRPFLANDPPLLKEVQNALDAAKKMPKMIDRAFALRKAIDDVRTKLQPSATKKKLVEVVPPPKTVTKKLPDIKVESEKEPKKDEPKKVEPKKEEPKKNTAKETKATVGTVELTLKGPETAKVGKTVAFSLKANNSGTKALDDVSVDVKFTDGLQYETRFDTYNQTLSLAAKEARDIPMDLVAGKTGVQKLTVTATIGNQSAKVEASVTVQAK